MWPTRKEMVEWMQESEDEIPSHKHETDRGEMLSEDTDSIMQTSISQDNLMVMEELVYPYELTLEMLKQYKGCMFNAEGTVLPIMRKLHRSCVFWRTEVPNWLNILIGTS